MSTDYIEQDTVFADNDDLTNEFDSEIESAYSDCEKELSKKKRDRAIRNEVRKELQTTKKSDFKDFKLIMDDYHSGDPARIQQAKDDACENLKGFIIYMIMRNFWTYCKNNFHDLLQSGYIGILKGLEVYNPEKAKPTTFFKTYIKSEISRYITEFLNHSTVHYASALNKINRAIRYFEANNIEYNDITLAEYTGIALTSVREALASKEAAISVNFQDELENESGASYQVGTTITNPETAIEISERERTVKAALENLSEIEKTILLCHYGFDGKRMSMREIAENLGITTQQVKIYHQNAINTLYNCRELDTYSNKKSRERCLFDNLLFFPIAAEEDDEDAFTFDLASFIKEEIG